jgi:hypothetical protein
LTTAFTIRTGSRQTAHATFFPARECQSGERPGAAPASISAADISACLPESVGRGSLVTEDLREVSPLSRRRDVILHRKAGPAAPSRPTPLRGGLTLYPTHYRSAFASSLVPSPLPRQLPLRVTFPRGEATGLLRSPSRSLRGEVVPLGRWRVIRDGGRCNPRTWPRTFWSEPDSILGSSFLTAFVSTSPGLTWPGRLAPDRLDAGSRRVGSRSHGRSRDRGYVVPQASDATVASNARWGSRPMAEHRVMSEDILGKRITGREDASNRTQRRKKQRSSPGCMFSRPSGRPFVLAVGLRRARQHGAKTRPVRTHDIPPSCGLRDNDRDVDSGAQTKRRTDACRLGSGRSARLTGQRGRWCRAPRTSAGRTAFAQQVVNEPKMSS